MAKLYCVAPGKSVLLRGGKLLRAGANIPKGALKPNKLKELETDGFIKRRGGEVTPDESLSKITHEGDLTKAKPVTTHGKFNRSPQDLQGRPLEELNVMLVDLNAEPVDTAEEAIALLSQDYNA